MKSRRHREYRLRNGDNAEVPRKDDPEPNLWMPLAQKIGAHAIVNANDLHPE
jgi:hypothetical protein